MKFEILAHSLAEAKQKALDKGMIITTNVTQSWKNAQCPINDRDFMIFAIKMMEKHRLTKIKGVGLIVVIDAGIQDTRKRPYKLINNIIKGRRSIERVIELRLKETDELIGRASNKNKAAKLAKSLMPKYCQDIIAPIVYYVTEGKELAFELKYEPSISTKLGKYIIFGNPSPDKN